MIFDKKAQILNLAEDAPDSFAWVESKGIWLHTEQQSKNNLFSKVGIGARSILFTMQPRSLTLHHAIRWRGRHYFLTAIDKQSPVCMEVTAALVDIRECTVTRPDDSLDEMKRPKYQSGSGDILVTTFPAVLTEKYMGFVQEAPMAQIEQTYVLITPKAVLLQAGNLVAVGTLGKYAVRLCHTLDEFKNEYEVYRKGDV